MVLIEKETTLELQGKNNSNNGRFLIRKLVARGNSK